MVKLNNGRKAALIIIAIIAILAVIMGQHQSSQTAAAAAPASPAVAPSTTAPAAAPVAPAAAAPTTTSPAAVTTPPAAQPTTASGAATSFTKFIVYQGNPNHNHYVLSGFMPTGNCLKANDAWSNNCHEGQRCIQINYDGPCSIQDQGWGGMYWLDPANNWGNTKGGYNLTGAQRLVFWARGEKGGEIIDSFKVGGITGDHKFPDSDTASIGPVILTKEWKQYSIDLKGKDLSYIVGGFAWAANAQANSQAVTFYLNDIYYE